MELTPEEQQKLESEQATSQLGSTAGKNLADDQDILHANTRGAGSPDTDATALASASPNASDPATGPGTSGTGPQAAAGGGLQGYNPGNLDPKNNPNLNGVHVATVQDHNALQAAVKDVHTRIDVIVGRLLRHGIDITNG